MNRARIVVWLSVVMVAAACLKGYLLYFGIQGAREAVARDIGGRQIVACPQTGDAFFVVVFGQSNGANYGNHRFSSRRNDVANYYGGRCVAAADPILGASQEGGSPWLPFADSLNTDQPVMIASFGRGGSAAGDWLSWWTLRPLLERTLRDLESAPIAPNLFIYVQGESDQATPPLVYRAQVEKVFARVRERFADVPIALSGSSYCFGVAAPQIVEAQRILAQEMDLIWLGETDDLRGENYRYDDCHLTREGMLAYSERFAQAVNRHFFSAGQQ